MNDEVTALAIKIADSCARADLECNLPWRTTDDEGVAAEIVRDGPAWYDTTAPEAEGQEWLTDALRYLELRGLLIRNEANPALVRVKDEA